MLDGASSRVRTLVGAAGYGKTTLAEQWVTQPGRRHGWYTARTASADVAALALGLARSASAVIEGSEVRLREHLRAVSAAGEHTTALAEILSEDLQSWPSDAWLVIDDYQEFVGAAEAEALVADLVRSSPVQLLITTRQRPTWVTTRSVIYGDVFEINQAALAMDNEEAAEVLIDWSAPSASGLVALADGWPAVIGLASVASAEIETEEAVPESLYRFLADEVFEALGDEVREGLSLLAVAPVLDRELAEKLLRERAQPICDAALEVGILVTRDDRLELHPLARAFLEERTVLAAPNRDASALCLRHYESRRDWDAAFDLIARRGLVDWLAGLLNEAMDDLLETARFSTIEAWCEHALRHRVDASTFALARAEVALRRGLHGQAKVYAEAAAGDRAHAFQALSLAGRSAHLASREEEALQLFQRAEAAADTDVRRLEALYGQLLCLIELESPDTPTAMETIAIECGVAADLRATIRSATARLSFQQRFGGIDLAEADNAFELIGTFSDPLLESSFLSAYSTCLALAARYHDALDAATRLQELSESFRFDFAIPYSLCWSAMALSGLRRWAEMDDSLSRATELAQARRNSHILASCRAMRIRGLLQQGRFEEATIISAPPAPLLPAMRGEFHGYRALALATSGRIQEASRTIDLVRGTTRAVEPRILTVAVDAVISLKRGETDAPHRIREIQRAAFAMGAPDLLVCAYRSVPELLSVLLKAGSPGDRLYQLVREVHDDDLAHAAGFPFPAAARAEDLLSPREREVYDLICQGLTNGQIAEILVIEESTVKAHAHHIYDKIGIRSRKDLAVRAALQRQATSATDTKSADPTRS